VTLPNNQPPSPTIPFAITGTNSGASPAGSGASAADLLNRTQAAITSILQAQVQASPNWNGSTASVYSGLRRGTSGNPVPWGLALLEKFLQNALGTSTTYTGFSSLFADVSSLFSGKWASLSTIVTSLQNLIDGVVGGSGNPLSSLINQLVYGTGTVDMARLPMIPVSAIGLGNPTPNLILNGDFSAANALNGGGDWTWDGTVDNTGTPGSGSAKATANGTAKMLLSNPMQVTQGQVLNVSGYTKWSGLTSTGSPIWLGLQTYLNGSIVSSPVVQAVSSPGVSGAFTALSGTYTVPAGVDTVRVSINVGSTATAGTVWYDDLKLTKSGLMNGSWMNGISGTVAADLQSITDGVYQGVNGGSSTGNALSSIKSSLQGFFGSSGSWSTLLSSLFGGSSIGSALQTSAIPNITKAMSTDLQSVIDGTASQFGGISITGASQANANSAMGGIFNTVLTTSQAVQQLQATTTGATVGGYSATENFSAMANGSLPADFTVNYTGAGTSTIGINNGTAHWTTVADSNRSAQCIYNVAPTLTDYQMLTATVANGPAQGAANYLFARMDSGGNNYVYAKFTSTGWLSYQCELGCVVAGTKTVWVAATNIPVNTSLQLLAGTPVSARQFQVVVGGTPVITYTDSSNTSQMGSSYRYWGFGGDVTVSGGKAAAPGDGVSVSIADHQPPAVAGSTFRCHRASTTQVSTSSGANKIPNSFFDTTDRISGDLTFTAGSNCSVTVTKQGTYLVTVRVMVGALVDGTGGYGIVYKNGSIYNTGAWAACSVNAGFGVNVTTADALYLSTPIYCAAGDVIQPGFYMNGSSNPRGESTGTQCYFELALLNPG
jgi:hypothetical protein